MSGVRGLNTLGAYPIPTAPLVDERGCVTPGWYRFFTALAKRTGGTSGRVTPVPEEPLTLLMSLLTQQDGGAGAGQQVFLGDVVEPQGQFVFPGDVVEPQGQVLGLDPVQEPSPQGLLLLDGLSQPAPVDALTVGASPYVYTPGTAGACIVSGGTVSAIAISRDDGTTWLATGLTSGAFPLERTDSIRVTYAVLPTMNFLQRAR